MCLCMCARALIQRMGIFIFDQPSAARTYGTCVSQSIFPLPLSICKAASLQRGKLQSPIANTATPSQAGRRGIAAKPHFTEPKWMVPADNKARTGATYQSSSGSFFQVVLRTSKDYCSGISDLNAGILLAFIGGEGRCFVHRIPTLVSTETVESEDRAQGVQMNKPDRHRFERGSLDVVTFHGPDLGKLEAVWVAPEKGTWRMEGMTVKFFPEKLLKDDGNTTEGTESQVMQYDFVCEEFLIGENDNNLAAELRPFKVSKISYDGLPLSSSKFEENSLQVPLGQLRDQGMMEYAALKFSLLGYDALFVILGSAIAAATGYKEVADGYLVGGVFGFFYLIVLEKAVDQLPAPPSSPPLVSGDQDSSVKDGAEIAEGRSSAEIDGNGTSSFGTLGGFRGPLTKISGILALAFLIAKSLNPSINQVLSKQMLLGGVAGFLMTKVATFLASNLPISSKEVLPYKKKV